jgi:hypothetical protein
MFLFEKIDFNILSTLFFIVVVFALLSALLESRKSEDERKMSIKCMNLLSGFKSNNRKILYIFFCIEGKLCVRHMAGI